MSATLLLYLAVALYLSRALVTWDDESAYVALGRLAVTGSISLFQDDMTGQRMPLPFYLNGASQVVFGRNLWAARLTSILVGIIPLGLTIAMARRLSGDLAGLLAGLLLATQGVIVGYYATATYHALTAAILMAAVWVLLKQDLRWRHALGMALASLLFFTRTNMFPAIPFFFVWAWLGARTASERVAVLMITGIPPAIFLFSDPTHLKLLAHVPLLNHFVAPLGYRSILSFSAVEHAGPSKQLLAFVLFARRYESWPLAAAGLAAVASILHLKGSLTTIAWRKGTTVVAALWIWILMWHFIIWRVNFRYAIAFFPTFAPLAAVLLGVAFATFLTRQDLPRLARAVLVATLIGASTVSLIFIRHPLLSQPAPRPFDGDPIQQLDRAAGDLRALVPEGQSVFLFAQPMVAYLADLNPPLQQFMSAGGTLAPAGVDQGLTAKNGVWGERELERWLGSELPYAVISPSLLGAFETLRPEAVSRIRELLAEHFVAIGQAGRQPLLLVAVYRRVDGRK